MEMHLKVWSGATQSRDIIVSLGSFLALDEFRFANSLTRANIKGLSNSLGRISQKGRFYFLSRTLDSLYRNVYFQ